MEELKTLNDFPCDCKTSCDCAQDRKTTQCDSDCHTVNKSDLRAEAVKWIRQDIDIGKQQGLIKEIPEYGTLPNEYQIMILRWMQRFNIKDEELVK